MNKFWNRKTMVDKLGFKVLGLDFGSNSSIYKYVKYFADKYSFILFDANKNQMSVIRLSKNDFEGYMKDEFGLSFDGSTKGITGKPLKPVTPINVNEMINRFYIENIKQMREALKTAEDLIIKQ
jgi:hypothetical protein